MPSKLIKLEDGTLIEIERPEADAAPIAGSGALEIEEKTIDQIKPIILKAAKPFIEVYKELDKDMEIREAELELGLGFEAEGNLFIRFVSSANHM